MMSGFQDKRNQETLETLAGERRGAARLAAVRIEDLAGLFELETRLQSSSAAGATPTAAEHDALVEDVQMLHRRLVAIMEALQTKVLE